MSDTGKTITAYKAFDADWSCRGFQYEVGQTYEHDGRVVLCGSGFHACEIPFDVWDYYEGSMNLGRVDLSGETDGPEPGCSKVCGAKLTFSAKLDLAGFIKAQAEVVIGLCKTAKKALVSKDDTSAHAVSGHAAATGDRGHAAATGDRGHAAATGDRGHAAATGFSGHAAATGVSGHAAATGYSGHAAVKGENAVAFAPGYFGKAKASEGSWIVLAAYDDDGNIVAVKSAQAGKGIDADVWYRLTPSGEFERAGG